MAMATHAGSVAAEGHPSPHDPKVGLGRILFGVFGGPAAWAAQLIANYGLASYSCYPRYAPRSQLVPGWESIWTFLLIINLVAVAVALVAASTAYRTWRLTRHEHPGNYGHALEAGEGRTRFLGIIGIMTGLGFFLATVFDTIALFIVPQCIG